VVSPVFRFRIFVISAIVEVQHIKVVQVPVLSGPLFGSCASSVRPPFVFAMRAVSMMRSFVILNASWISRSPGLLQLPPSRTEHRFRPSQPTTRYCRARRKQARHYEQF
jgi:hypothetical protein